MLPEESGIYDLWKRFVGQYSVSGRKCCDARRVACASVHGIETIGCTSDLGDHAATLCEYRSQKSSKRPLSFEQRKAMMAFAPFTVQCIPARLSLVPTTTLQPASTTPVAVHNPCS